MPRESNERRYWEALARIKQYMRPAALRRSAEKQYGLSYEEALEYAYENVIGEAEEATRGRRAPTVKAGPPKPPDGGAVANQKSEAK